MNFVLASFVVVGFAVTIDLLGLVNQAMEVGKRSKESIEVLRDSSMSDREKEEAMQDQSRKLFVLFGILLGGGGLALALPLAIVWLLGRAGIGTFHGTLATLSRVDFLIGIIVVGIPIYLLTRRVRNR